MPQLSTLYRTAFVTGTSAGLGRAYATMLLAEGVQVWGTARDKTRLAGFAADVGFHPVILDLSDGTGSALAFSQAAKEAGGFDLVINNAGYGVFAPFASVDFSIWQAQLSAMLTTTAQIAHAALQAMLATNRGCLVNVASLATDFPLPFMSGYNAAKAGLSALSESLIFETRGTAVVVIDFRPGDYRTAFNDSMRETAGASDADPRLGRTWQTLEANINAAPAALHAAAALRAALLRHRSGVVRCGSFFQARLAPFLVRFAPAGLRRAVMARYFGIG